LIDLSLAQAPGLVPAGRGTPSYLSPEQGVGGLVSGASDVWGLGLTLFVAATGVKPFMNYLQLTNRAPRARSLRRMPRTLADALDACLEPSPPSRPTLAELDQTFNAVAGTDRPAW
jgi:eukaryotic-like serine/threonine-protein kinase